MRPVGSSKHRSPRRSRHATSAAEAPSEREKSRGSSEALEGPRGSAGPASFEGYRNKARAALVRIGLNVLLYFCNRPPGVDVGRPLLDESAADSSVVCISPRSPSLCKPSWSALRQSAWRSLPVSEQRLDTCSIPGLLRTIADKAPSGNQRTDRGFTRANKTCASRCSRGAQDARARAFRSSA